MPLFHVLAYDKPAAQALRLAHRPAHLEYARSLGANLKLGGPILGEDNETMIGSVMIIEAQDRAALDRVLTGDPYVRAGLFARVEIHPFRWVVNAP